MKEIFAFFKKLLHTADLPPRWQNGNWTSFNGWLYIISDLLIWASFFTIPFFILKFFFNKNVRGFVKPAIFVASFAIACGSLFFLDAIMFWLYLQGLGILMRLVTAILSCIAVYYIYQHLPYIFSIKPFSHLQEEMAQRKKAEDELILSEQRFKTLVKNGSDMIGIMDEAGNYSYVSPNVFPLLGMHQEEFTGKNAYGFIHEDDKQRITASFAELETVRRVKIAPFRFRHKNGSYLWIEAVLNDLRDDPAINGIVSNSRDVTQLFSAAAQIAENENQYAYLIQNLPTAFYTCNAVGKIMLFNKAAVDLWGGEPEIGNDHWCASCKLYRSDGSLLPFEESPMALSLVKQTALPGMEITVLGSDGKIHYVLPYPSPLFNLAGELTGTINILIDITERKNIYAKLVKTEMDIRNFAKQQNNLLEEERSRIAREIHDEFGQQLAGIKMSLSSLIRPSNSDNRNTDLVKNMVSEVDNTMQSLRRFATELRPGILDTLGLVSSIEWLLGEFENKTGILCESNILVEETLFDKSLSISFFRICQEALTNILKHANATSVFVQFTQSDDELMLTIADNGTGIINEKLDNPFSMGILGMRERANLVGAKLSISSQPGAGTTIILIATINGQ